MLNSDQVQTVAGRAQACFAMAIVLLGGGDAGVAHGIPDRNQILAIIQHGRGKGSP